MAKTSFANIDKNVTDIPAAPDADSTGTNPNTAVEQTQSSAVVPDSFFDNGDGFGETDSNQLSVPYLSVAHGVGELAQLGFIPGSLVWNKTEILLEPGRGTTAIAPKDGVEAYIISGLGGGLTFVENLSQEEYDAGVKARIFANEREARTNGLVKKSEANGDTSLRTYGPRLQVKVIVKARNPSESAFPFEFNGQRYNFAALSLSKGSYWGAGRTIYDAVNTARLLKKPLMAKRWSLYTKYIKAPASKNGAWALYAQQMGDTDAALAEYFKSITQ